MSALLPVCENVKELNILKESGYTTRVFSKSINVRRSTQYQTALVLAHISKNRMNNRKENYRNHFTLYQNNTTLVLVRSETTLLYRDHDAILEYDVFTPKGACMRTSCVDDSWLVSYDTIEYSNAKPESFATYSLLCWGEWWYFDRGVCLNGITAYERGTVCDSMFIYLELHPKIKLVRPLQQQQPQNLNLRSVVFNNAAFQPDSVNSQPIPSGSQPSVDTANTIAPNNVENNNNSSTNTNQQQTADTNTIQNNTALFNPLIRNTTCPSFSMTNNSTIFSGSAFNNFITPTANIVSREQINTNDSRKAPKSIFKQIMPSLFWFEERHHELQIGDISYFIPM
uniref:GrBNV_gp23-like protein n=1 Tax=Nilaparvata lugens endogenous nudivirus TaxID=1487700 RepID=X5GE61_9VIRU|nr:GrBNV_gp23-like protein [Nilaparvata lugens endogenous nudivirus]